VPLWIKTPLACLDPDHAGGIVVDGGCIAELVPKGGRPRRACDQVFDASNHVLLPGLINTHHHFFQTLTRALARSIDKELFPWLQALYPVWSNIDKGAFRLASRLAMAELLLSGCTTASDHQYLFPGGLEHAIDIQVEEARALGLRIVLCRGSMDLSVEDGGLPPRNVTQSIDTILADCERVATRFHQRGAGAMTQVALGPCTAFTASGDLMRQTAKLAESLDLRLHTHLAETEDENRYCLACHSMRPLDYLEELGWLGPRIWYAHGIHFLPSEMNRLGAAGAGIAHCPSSNMILGSGICQVRALEARGVAVGLGVDGSASNDASNMIQELRQALLLARAGGGINAATHRDPIRWATEGSARCLSRDDIGGIAFGKRADLALFRLDGPRFSGAEDKLAALIICGAQKADHVMVEGVWRVVDGAIPGLDLDQLCAQHSAAARRLWTMT
jgi:8-oxoguanine deaminase